MKLVKLPWKCNLTTPSRSLLHKVLNLTKFGYYNYRPFTSYGLIIIFNKMENTAQVLFNRGRETAQVMKVPRVMIIYRRCLPVNWKSTESNILSIF